LAFSYYYDAIKGLIKSSKMQALEQTTSLVWGPAMSFDSGEENEKET
jgi:hypothetical protein